VRDDGPFRRSVARPPALVALAAGAPERRIDLPRDAAGRRDIRRRLHRAAAIRAADPISVKIGVVAGTVLMLGGLATDLAWAGVIGAILLVHTAVTAPTLRQQAVLDQLLASPAALPFPVHGFDLWLAAEVPLFDVYLRHDVDRPLVVDAIHGVDPHADVTWQARRVVRIALPAQVVRGWRVGDPAAWDKIVGQVLLPLHADVGIDRIEMGGRMRALTPG
jgi:hypothetical protein